LFRSARFSGLAAAIVVVGLALPLRAQQETFEVDPAQSKVEFTLGDILHTVHGTFRLKPGRIGFNKGTGVASGELVVDANSGDSGNGTRDRKMKKEILETQKYPDITFTPRMIKGKVLAQGASQIAVDGILTLHGDAHPMTLAIQVNGGSGSTSADTAFVVPYVKWGLKNPSTLFLRVNDHVEITVHAVGRLASDP